jgi:hypothetical protein
MAWRIWVQNGKLPVSNTEEVPLALIFVTQNSCIFLCYKLVHRSHVPVVLLLLITSNEDVLLNRNREVCPFFTMTIRMYMCVYFI